MPWQQEEVQPPDNRARRSIFRPRHRQPINYQNLDIANMPHHQFIQLEIDNLSYDQLIQFEERMGKVSQGLKK